MMAAPASAQFYADEEKKSRSEEAFAIYNQLPPEDQKRLMEETTKVEATCLSKGLFSSFHDCTCVATRFFEERIFKPELNYSIIQLADIYAEECPNLPGVAGHAFKQCKGTYATALSYNLEEFCTCYANEYAQIFSKDARAFIPHMAKVGARAMIACDKQGMASPLNPDR